MVLQETRVDYYKAWLTVQNSARTVVKVSERTIAKVGISIGEFHVLRTLAASGPCPMVDLAKEQFISPPALTSIVDSLEKQGLVERLRSKKDRRIINIKITNKGKKLFAQAQPLYKRFFEKVMRSLTKQEISVLLTAFEQLSKSAQMYPIEHNSLTRAYGRSIHK
ncbi:MAG: MarR family winged helix-turn-helix transcriptional regulator [Nitrososphaerales archaeon]